jgi:hypothetical protein
VIDLCMVWRREDPKQPALEAIAEGAKHYRAKNGALPNFVNVPPGFLTEAEIAQLRERWTVAMNAPAYFKNDVWLGVMTPADATPRNSGGEKTVEGRTQ